MDTLKGILLTLAMIVFIPTFIWTLLGFLNSEKGFFLKVIQHEERYGVQKLTITGYEMLNLNDFSGWHSGLYKHKYCWGTKERAIEGYNLVKEQYKTVKIED